MNTIDFGKLHLQTGLRIEGTQMMTFGYNLTFYGTIQHNAAGLRRNDAFTNCYCFYTAVTQQSFVCGRIAQRAGCATR